MSSINMRGFASTTSKKQALEILLSKVESVKAFENIAVQHSLNRVLAEDIISQHDLPPFNRAAMDGYALKFDDSIGASFESPIRLKVVGRVDAGDIRNIEIDRMETVEIMTGARVPEKTDCVIMAEYTKRLSEDTVEIYQQLTPWSNIDLKGSDVHKGEVILGKGTIIKPADIGLLKSLRLNTVKVYRPPKVGLISTGDELTDFPKPSDENSKVVESNQIMLSAYILEDGGEPLKYGIVPDNSELIKNILLRAVAECDIILVTGGTSVGRKDLVPKIIRDIGLILVHGISMKPGKPTGLALVQGKPVILMPGYSVACIIAYTVFCRPLIQRFLNINPPRLQRYVTAFLTQRIPSTAGRTDFVRVQLFRKGKQFYATPIRSTGSGILSSVVKANGLLEIPDEIEGYEEGDTVSVMLLRDQIAEDTEID
ncbi:MAG: molybdopterin molybdotransferase MoeA [Candidatus Odinarchaeota archaeon]